MSFAPMKLIESLQQAITKEGYTTPTPIQEQAIPLLLEGKDIIGIAQTGTGKTAAFVLPILQRMTAQRKILPRGTPRCLVLAPTRELAAQIGESFAAYGRFLRFRHTVVFGGVSQVPQVRELNRGIDILVATPGRLLDLMEQGHVHLGHVEFFVLDEADRMLDMGFIPDVRRIATAVPKQRQTLLFSATMSREVTQLAHTLLQKPARVEVAPQATTVERVEQKVFFVDTPRKDDLLLELLDQKHLSCVLVFTRTKHRANKVAKMLSQNRFRADAIHGNKTQNQRTKTLQDFKAGRIKVLVATDIAARGIDIEDISHVINYDLPNESESYVHRIGRTARAGAEGTAFSFCAADERDYLRDIEKLIRQDIPVAEHQYHSERARMARGAEARPPPKRPFVRRSDSNRSSYGGGRPSGGRAPTRGSSGGFRRDGPRSSSGGRGAGKPPLRSSAGRSQGSRGGARPRGSNYRPRA